MEYRSFQNVIVFFYIGALSAQCSDKTFWWYILAFFSETIHTGINQVRLSLCWFVWRYYKHHSIWSISSLFEWDISKDISKDRHFKYSFNRHVFYVFLLRSCILLCRSIWVGSLHWLLIIRCALLRKNGWDGIRIISVVQQQHKISSITFLIWVIWTSKYFPVVKAYPL